MRRIAVSGLVLMVLAGVLVGGAQRAEAREPSALRACATYPARNPYVGPATLVTGDWWIAGRTLRTSRRGCITFPSVQPGRDYRVIVNLSLSPCFTSMRPDGTTFRYGTESTIVGVSAWRRAPRSGTVNFPLFTVNRVDRMCS